MRDLGFEPVETGEYYFLSYNSQDADRIAPLFKALSDSGIPIWYDKGIRYDTLQWSSEIANHIKNCKAVLFAQTKGLVKKENSYAKREYEVAQSFKKEIFILAFDQVSIESAAIQNAFFVQELNSKQQIPVTGDYNRDAEEICRILKVDYKEPAKALPKDPPKKKSHKILLPAIAAVCAAALIALFFIIRPVPPFPAAPTPAPTAAPTEEPTPIPDPWMCKWCGSMNGYENDLCWKCKMPKDTTPMPTDTPEPPTPTPTLKPTDTPVPLSVKVGDHITFGHYPQTAEGTDNTPIEWRVLDVQDGKALVISEYGLDTQPYNEEHATVTWEQCTLREWLNSEFLNKAFNSTEQAAILLTEITNDSSQSYYSTSCGNNTQDKIFLLSYAEACNYFGKIGFSGIVDGGNIDSRAEPTEYAKERVITDNDYKTSTGNAAGWWWLRSPGRSRYYASSIISQGILYDSFVSDSGFIVRPVFWLDLTAAGGLGITVLAPTPTPGPIDTPIPLSMNVGDHITFGHYPQTTEGTDSTPIEWRVLDVQGDKALVISEYVLDAQPYNTDNVRVTWETCSLRKWLNNDFFDKAFTSTEQAFILETAVKNERSQGFWDTKGGNNTQDKIFLLSYTEANNYFGITCENDNNSDSRAGSTAYAVKQGTITDSNCKTNNGNAAGSWWLRSPGNSRYLASYVRPDGSLYRSGVHSTDTAVRPVFWLDLNAADRMDITILRHTPLSVKAGNHLVFGHYPQTAEGTDSMPIEWRVLDVQGDRALVISEYGLDAQKYNEKWADVTWEQCTLRGWLNNYFLNKAFSSAEQASILTTTVKNDKSQHYSGYSDTYKDYADTQDKIFLLSYAEASQYFNVTKENLNNVYSRVAPTEYAIKRGAGKNNVYKTSSEKDSGWWWLRSPSDSSDSSIVSADGSLGSSHVHYLSTIVRPALWLDLNAFKN